MILINIDKAIENAERLKLRRNSSQVLVDSLEILKPDKKNIIRKIFFFGIEIFISWKMATQAETVVLTKEVFEILITILVSLIAVVFTGYAIFQALLNDTILIALLNADDEKANLSGSNRYFAKVMIFQMACTIVDLFVIIFAIIVPNDWCAFNNEFANNLLAGVFLLCVLHCNLESIWEMKSFIFNVFQLFNLHAYARIQAIKEKNDMNKD